MAAIGKTVIGDKLDMAKKMSELKAEVSSTLTLRHFQVVDFVVGYLESNQRDPSLPEQVAEQIAEQEPSVPTVPKLQLDVGRANLPVSWFVCLLLITCPISATQWRYNSD